MPQKATTLVVAFFYTFIFLLLPYKAENKYDMKNSFFNFTKNQRKELLIFFSIIVIAQIIYLQINTTKNTRENNSLQNQAILLQKQIDSIKNLPKEVFKLHPFNPNYITDFKGYQLGMSTQEIDKLLAYRKSGKFINSTQEFQSITGISDSLLNKIAPYFKFPDWVTKKQTDYSENKKAEKIIIKDLNKATKEDLMQVYGIGDKLSDRILEYKSKLSAFVSVDQLNEIYGLSPEVISEINKRFKITEPPMVNKIKINQASIKELGSFPYFKYPISKEIVQYRSKSGSIQNVNDLTKINGFPVEKIGLIALYLEF